MAGVVQEREGNPAIKKGEDSYGRGVNFYFPEKCQVQIEEITEEYPDRSAVRNDSNCASLVARKYLFTALYYPFLQIPDTLSCRRGKIFYVIKPLLTQPFIFFINFIES